MIPCKKGRTSIIALILCFACQGLSAQQSTRLTDNWEFLRQDLGGVWEAVRPFPKGDPAGLPIWTSVQLPHCVNAEDAVDPRGNYYRGPAWYRTQLDLHNPYAKGRTLLHFEGAGQKTEVYVYTTRVGSHTGGYDEWTVDITDAADAFARTSICRQQFKGKIPVTIRTDNSRDLEMIPSGLSDFSVYGGIYRYLNLIYAPSVSIDQVFARAEMDKAGKEGKVHLRAQLYSPALDSGRVAVSAQLIDPDGQPVPRGKTRSLTTDFFITGGKAFNSDSLPDLVVRSPRQWSPDHPSLYTLIVSVSGPDGIYSKTTKIGFRNFTFTDHGPFLLNGQRLLLKGTHRHEDHAGLGAAMTEDLMRSEMVLVKEMGVNFIRLAHYQQSPIILDLCDSLGILVWEEIPWCRGGLGGDLYKDQARRMLSNMIGQHYDHPSVIIWGLGNENDWPGDFPEFDKEKIRAFMKELNDLAHHLDPSRMTAIRRCDFCKDIPDVYSPTLWAGWYKGIYTDYKKLTEEEFKKVDHFLHVEWGGDSHARRHSETPDGLLMGVSGGRGMEERAADSSLYAGAAKAAKDGDWSESYICNLVDWHLKEQETMSWLTGTAQWAFKDFSTPLRPDNPIPFVNQKGVVERDLTKKEVYYVFQSYWTSKPMAHIYGHSWPVRWGNEGEEKMVKLYSNCDEATLFLNGRSCGSRMRNSQDFPAAGLRWKVVFQKGGNTLRVVARKGSVIVEDSISLQYQTGKWGKPAKALLERVGEADGIATIRVRLVDDKDVPCLDAADWISFGLAGDGKLIDDQGTSTGSRYVQAYNGQAIIRVQLREGQSVISAKAGDLPSVFLRITSSIVHARDTSAPSGRTVTRDERMAWWRDARFGMFIHWGVYAQLAGVYDGHPIGHAAEWIMNRGKIPVADYQQVAHQFNPVRYDPDAWVRMAKDAGMKYIVITAKHHDGFALFGSKASKWNIVDATPYGKDLLQPLAAACRKYGIKLGFYYSQAQDWNNPGGAAARKVTSEGWPNPDSARIDAYTLAHSGHWDPAQTTAPMSEYIDKVAVPQVRELLTNYGDVAVLWWDTPTNMTDEYAQKLQDVLALQPNIITNDRLERPDFPGDYKTPEQKIPNLAELDGRDWETCMTMNGTWGYKSADHNWKTPATLIHNLVDIASKGGNYLLNVGPTPEGEFPQASIDALKAIGAWMKVNGEAIYGTKSSPFGVLPWGRCTRKENGADTLLYFSVFDWPSNGRLLIPGLKGQVIAARLLADGSVLSAESTPDGLVVHVPDRAPDTIATVIRLEVK